MDALASLGDALGSLGNALGGFGGALGGLGDAWGKALGTPGKPTWANMRQLGANLGPTRGPLGPTWAIMGPTWSPLGAHLEPTWAKMSQHGATLGPTWGSLGANLHRAPSNARSQRFLERPMSRKPQFLQCLPPVHAILLCAAPSREKPRKNSRFGLENRGPERPARAKSRPGGPVRAPKRTQDERKCKRVALRIIFSQCERSPCARGSETQAQRGAPAGGAPECRYENLRRDKI